MMSDAQHQKTRKRVIGEVVVLLGLFAIVMSIIFFVGKPWFMGLYERNVRSLPVSAVELIR